MSLGELEQKVARLLPRRLTRRGASVVEAAASADPPPGAEPLTKPTPSSAAPPIPGVSPVPAGELVPQELEPGARDVRERLLQRGASPALADRIVRGVLAADARGAFAIDAAVAELARAFRFAAPPLRAQAPHVVSFVGPTGAGKSATLAKLGRRLAGAGRSVFFATFDPSSARTDVDRSELPLQAVRDVDDLHERLVAAGGAELILVDTPGHSPRDRDGLEALAVQLRGVSRLGTPHTYLVLPASASRSALGLATRAYRRTAPTAAIVTKLDETGEPGAALEEAQHAGLPLAFFCDGQDLRGHLARAGAERVADLFLRGHLA